MAPNIETIGIISIIIIVAVCYIWMIWPTSREETKNILTPEKPLRRIDEVQEDLHLSEIRPATTVPDFSQT